MADYMELVKNGRLRETMIDRCEQELNHKWTGREMRFVGGDVSKPKTNADRIQEKLAEVLSGMCKVAEDCDFCPMDGNCPGGSYDLHVWDNWLQQPAEGD